MKPKTYRRLTTCLFLFLFLVFFLLFLLLQNRGGASPNGGGWGELHREMGTIRLSEIHSGGFIVDAFPFPQSTRLGAPDFNDQVARCSAVLYNEGEADIRVILKVHGTDFKQEGVDNNKGLCGALYYYTGESDPVAPDYAAFLRLGQGCTRYPPEDKNMTLYLREDSYPMELMIAPGETVNLDLFFWVDEGQIPQLIDPTREGYSVTVKLISRAA